MEFFFPEGFKFDYQWRRRSIGMMQPWVTWILFGSAFWLFTTVSGFIYLFMGGFFLWL